jgi:hypothetical protein
MPGDFESPLLRPSQILFIRHVGRSGAQRVEGRAIAELGE